MIICNLNSIWYVSYLMAWVYKTHPQFSRAYSGKKKVFNVLVYFSIVLFMASYHYITKNCNISQTTLCIAENIINSPPLTDCLDSLSQRHNVASLSIFYRYFHVDCSSELANCMPPLLLRFCCTRLSTSSHPYSFHLPNARVNQYLHSFIPYTGKLWNSLHCLFFHLPMT